MRFSAFGLVSIFFAALVLVFALAGHSLADPPRSFRQLSIDDGLPQSTVTATLHREDGSLWIGTAGGLAIWDGNQLEHIFHHRDDENSPLGNVVQDLLDTGEGVWIATHGFGLSYRGDDGTWQHYRADTGALLSDTVLDLADGPDGQVWIGTKSGLHIYDPATGALTHGEALPVLALRDLGPTAVRAMARLADGSMLIGFMEAGLAHYVPETQELKRYFIPSPELPQRDIAGPIYAIAQTRDGRVWYTTAELGIEEFDPDRGRIPSDIGPETATMVPAIATDDGRLWFGAYSRGLFVYDPATGHLANTRADPARPRSLPSDTIRSLSIGRSGEVWVGTNDAGLARTPISTEPFTTYFGDPEGVKGPRARMVWSVLAQDADRILVGHKDGLSRLDRRVHRFEDITLPEAVRDIRAMLRWKGGIVLASFTSGLLWLDPVTGEVSELATPAAMPVASKLYPRLLLVDPDNRLWVGTQSGLFVLDENGALLDDAGLSSLGDAQIRGLSLVDGKVYVGLLDGLVRWLPQEGRFEPLVDPDGFLSASDSRAVGQSPADPGYLYVATGMGLVRLKDDASQATLFGLAEGLSNETLYSVLADKSGNLWISSDNGLMRFNPETAEAESFGGHHDLQGAEFNFNAFAVLPDGKLAFGGVNGLSIVSPEDPGPHEPPPRLWAKVSIAGQDLVAGGEALRLRAGKGSLLTDFSVRHFADPARNRVEWRISPRMSEWVRSTAARGQIADGDFKPGDYRLELRPVSSHNTAGTVNSYEFSILSPLWQTPPALLGFVLLGTALAYMGARLNNMRQRVRHRQLEFVIDERTRALEEANMRLRDAARRRREFYAGAAHEIRAPLAMMRPALSRLDAGERLSKEQGAALDVLRQIYRRIHAMVQEMSRVAGRADMDLGGQITLDIGRHLDELFAGLAAQPGLAVIPEMSRSPEISIGTLDREALDVVVSGLFTLLLRGRAGKSSLNIRPAEAALELVATLPDRAEAAALQAQLRQHDAEPSRPLSPLLRQLHLAFSRANAVTRFEEASLIISIPAMLPPCAPEIVAEAVGEDADQVLIVEDSADMRALLVDLIEPVAATHGIGVSAVGSAAAARRQLDRRHVALLVCDIRLPGESGLSLAAHLRADPAFAHLPILFVSGFDDAETRHQVDALRGAELLSKPFTEDELKRRVDRYLLTRHPSIKSPPAMSSQAQTLVPQDDRMRAAIDAALSENPAISLDEMAAALNQSSRSFQRNVQRIYGEGFRSLSGRRRIECAKSMLLAGSPIKQVAHHCGYVSPSAFTRRFRQSEGLTPSEWLAAREAEGGNLPTD